MQECLLLLLGRVVLVHRIVLVEPYSAFPLPAEGDHSGGDLKGSEAVEESFEADDRFLE